MGSTTDAVCVPKYILNILVSYAHFKIRRPIRTLKTVSNIEGLDFHSFQEQLPYNHLLSDTRHVLNLVLGKSIS